jgi:hypothetical protein
VIGDAIQSSENILAFFSRCETQGFGMTEPERKYSIAIGRNPEQVRRILRQAERAKRAIRQVEIVDPDGAKVLVFARGCTLSQMRARRQITDEQFEAGRWLERLHELAQIGSPRSVDLNRPRVNGGKVEPLPDSKLRAMDDLARVERVLGARDWSLLFDVLVQGLSISQAATMRKATTRGEIEHLGRRFRDALRDVAAERTRKE